MRKYLIPVFVIASLAAFNCGNKKSTTDVNINADYKLPPVDTAGAVVGDWVIQRELADPQRLNPITVQDAIGQELSYYIFERMLWAADRTTYETIPWLAESKPEMSDDHLE